MKPLLLLLLSCCLLACQVDSKSQTDAPAAAAAFKTGAEQPELYLPLLKGKRVGVLVNQTSLIGQQHLVDELLRHGVYVVSIFAPEHGFRGDHDAGAKVSSGTDSKTGLPLLSLYGASKKPSAEQMQQLDIYDAHGLVFVTPTSFGNVYDHLVDRVWKRSLQRCGLKPRRLYAHRHSFLSHALAMGNSPADLAAAAGHSTKMLLDTYAKPTGRLKMPSWQPACK